jgi:hypothetical protein
MRSPSDNAADPAELRDKALNLRESVNSSRARMSAQQERLEKLRRDLAELRELVSKEPAPVSASAAASFRTGSRFGSLRSAPYVAIFFAAMGLQVHATRPRAAVTMPPMPAVAEAPNPAPLLNEEDGGAQEALLLAHEWKLPGDERSLSERLGADTNPPGSKPEWTAERTGERTYRVTFQPSGADAGYDFDVDLAARRVDPTPETAELISPRLASRL